MPKSIGGRKLSKKQHSQWKKVFNKTGSGAIATSAVKKSFKKKGRKKGGK